MRVPVKSFKNLTVVPIILSFKIFFYDDLIWGVTFTQTLPININWDSEFDFEGRGNNEFAKCYFSQVDYDYVDVFDMEIRAGRNFSREITTDASGGGAYILSETAVKHLVWENPIGKKLGFPGNDNMGTVIGVVKDFNSHSLHLPAEPVVLILNTTGGNIYFLSIMDFYSIRSVGSGDCPADRQLQINQSLHIQSGRLTAV